MSEEMNKGKLLPMLFILGRGRSGSTLLKTMLDAHPQICIPGESRFLQYMYYHFRKAGNSGDKVRKAFMEALPASFEAPPFDMEELRLRLENLPAEAGFREMIQAAYLSIPSVFPKSNIRLIGDKNPRYVFFATVIARLFPSARFIHVIRDCRDSTLSFMKVKGMESEKKNAAFLACRWNIYNRQVERLSDRFPERFLRIRYEDLVMDPETILRNICSFAGLDFDPAMLNYHQKVNELMEGENVVYRDIHQGLLQTVNADKCGIWKTKMTARDQKATHAIAGRMLKSYGYEVPPGGEGSGKTLLYLPQRWQASVPLYAKKVLYRIPWLMRTFYAIKKR